jgi:hypothetical protein
VHRFCIPCDVRGQSNEWSLFGGHFQKAYSVHIHSAILLPVKIQGATIDFALGKIVCIELRFDDRAQRLRQGTNQVLKQLRFDRGQRRAATSESREDTSERSFHWAGILWLTFNEPRASRPVGCSDWLGVSVQRKKRPVKLPQSRNLIGCENSRRADKNFLVPWEQAGLGINAIA